MPAATSPARPSSSTAAGPPGSRSPAAPHRGGSQAAGGGTFLNDLLREAGADNLVADRSGWPVLSPEYVATVPVELLVIPDSEQTREAYARAFRSGPLSRGPVTRARVVRLDESALTRPGPRVFDVLEKLAESLS